jgi:hypothetical protein
MSEVVDLSDHFAFWRKRLFAGRESDPSRDLEEWSQWKSAFAAFQRARRLRRLSNDEVEALVAPLTKDGTGGSFDLLQSDELSCARFELALQEMRIGHMKWRLALYRAELAKSKNETRREGTDGPPASTEPP